jgi:hypothetical protein
LLVVIAAEWQGESIADLETQGACFGAGLMQLSVMACPGRSQNGGNLKHAQRQAPCALPRDREQLL